MCMRPQSRRRRNQLGESPPRTTIPATPSTRRCRYDRWPHTTRRQPHREALPPLARVLAGGLFCLLSSYASAAGLEPFEPGSSPCGDACPIGWAAPAFGVPEGNPVRMMLPAGAVLDGMSYARDGIPYASGQGYYTTRDMPGEGYLLPDGRLFFRFDACGNWAPAILPIAEAPSSLWPIHRSTTHPPSELWSPRLQIAPPPTGELPLPEPPPVELPPIPVPLPAAGVLFLLALSVLMVSAGRKGRV